MGQRSSQLGAPAQCAAMVPCLLSPVARTDAARLSAASVDAASSDHLCGAQNLVDGAVSKLSAIPICPCSQGLTWLLYAMRCLVRRARRPASVGQCRSAGLANMGHGSCRRTLPCQSGFWLTSVAGLAAGHCSVC